MTPHSVTTSVYSTTVYSDGSFDPDKRAQPPASDWRTARDFRNLLTADPPGVWADNRFRQVEHFRSVPYIAITRVMGLVGGASCPLMRRNRKPKNKTTFGPNGTIAKATPTSQQQGRDEDYTPFEDYDHPLAKLVRSPNPNESMGEFLAKVVLQNRLTGVGPVWAVGSKSNPARPVEMWALRTPFMYPLYQQNQTYPNGAWKINPYRAPGWFGATPGGMGAGGAIIPAEDVKRFLDPHPIIDWDGWSPLTAGAVQLDVFDSVETSRKSAMDRGLNLDVLAIVPGATDKAVDSLTASLEARHGGASKSRRVAVLAPPTAMGEKFTVSNLSTNPREMDYQQTYQQTLEFVLALFGVPSAVAGFGSEVNYASWFASRQQFYDSQEDYLNRIAVWFTREFLRPWESYPGEFVLKIKPKPIGDKELSEKQFERQLKYDLLTYNQALAKDDLPPVEGGDVLVSVYIARQTQKAMPQPAAGDAKSDAAKEPGGAAPPFGKPETAPVALPPSAPRPANPAAVGSLAPRKAMSSATSSAMSSLVGSEGGALVPPSTGRMGRRKKRGLRPVLSRLLKALSEE